jgi:predicted  nucleic acid-binding Zn-ribbon protein
MHCLLHSDRRYNLSSFDLFDNLSILSIFLTKDSKYSNEVNSPLESTKVLIKEDGLYYINFKKILTDNKELESVHSGNVNKIQLPCKLPYLTMFRVENIGENIE